jgi:hypothetical protein
MCTAVPVKVGFRRAHAHATKVLVEGIQGIY